TGVAMIYELAKAQNNLNMAMLHTAEASEAHEQLQAALSSAEQLLEDLLLECEV
ncbi:MAG: hypothetical protein MHM6MM_007074, partial [Cercozoa sp. M6MM]